MADPDHGIAPSNAGKDSMAAPPEPHTRNAALPGLTREYRSESISVFWFADRCTHSGECIRTLPRVFNPRRRPWVRIEAAEADAIADAVLRCPTGALHYIRHDGGAQEPTPVTTTIQTVPGGPYYVRGPMRVTDSSGDIIRDDNRMALCRCGQSLRMPFCDNSHRAFGFDEQVPKGGGAPPDSPGG